MIICDLCQKEAGGIFKILSYKISINELDGTNFQSFDVDLCEQCKPKILNIFMKVVKEPKNMKVTKIFCDSCSKEIPTLIDNSFPLLTLTDNLVYNHLVYPTTDGNYYFCDENCLKEWVNRS